MNTSAGAYAWLADAVRSADPALWDGWWRNVEPALSGPPELLFHDPWPHDYWVGHGVRYSAIAVAAQTWRNRRALDDWPLLHAERAGPAFDEVPRAATAADGLDRVLAASPPLGYDHGTLLSRFDVLRDGADFGDPAQVTSEVAVAWLSAVLGSSLAGIVLAPTEDPESLGAETRRRLEAVWLLAELGHGYKLDLLRATEALFAAEWTDGRPALPRTQQGQPRTAHDHWYWLGHELKVARIREAVGLAAGLLVSPPVLAALIDTATGDDDWAPLGLAALRRWALGLRVMAWLEQALDHSWQDVRPVDVVAFAYAAVAPWWPRPSIAVSHRSGDAKPEMVGRELWGTVHLAVDATTVPSWETNTGLIWRLFAATPIVVRVGSANYESSLWCRREAELTGYLVEHADFFRGRTVVDVPLEQIAVLDRAVAALAAEPVSDDVWPYSQVPDRPLPDGKLLFPPPTLVLEVPSHPPLILDVLAAGATLRLLNGLIGDVSLVNAIAKELTAGRPLDLPPPTNHPDGWAIHREIFQRLAGHRDGGAAPIRMALDYPEDQRAIDIDEVVLRLPDLTRTACPPVDLLAAAEWNSVIRRWFTDKWDSQRAVVDCRGLDPATWLEDRRHGIKRGMVEMPTETLVFITQNAGQDVHLWPVVRGRDTPILTQHVPDQLRWMGRAFTLPMWIVAYTSLPDYNFASSLQRALFAALTEDFQAYPSHALPENYSDVFAMDVGPDSVLYDSLREIGFFDRGAEQP